MSSSKIRLIGVGNCGTSIVSKFGKYEGYSVLSVDNEQHDMLESKVLPVFTEGIVHEQYDSMEYDWDGLTAGYDEAQVFVTGASDVSGCILQLLKHLHENNVKTHIVYIYPDVTFLTELKKTQHKVTFGILQEYTRSGLVEKMIIFDNSILGQMIGKTTIANYYSKINEKIADMMHSFNYCRKNKPIFGNNSNFLDITRISCLGYGMAGEDINLFYDLKSNNEEIIYPLEIQYYFLIPKEKVENDENLMTEIQEMVQREEEKYKSISYGVFQIDTEQEDISVVVWLCTSKVQQPQLTQ